MKESYARGYASSPMHSLEVSVGIELRDGDFPPEIITTAHAIAYNVMNATELSLAERAGLALERIDGCFSGRAYFVEVEDDGKGVQVYDPRGFLKERCSCPCTRAP